MQTTEEGVEPAGVTELYPVMESTIKLAEQPEVLKAFTRTPKSRTLSTRVESLDESKGPFQAPATPQTVVEEQLASQELVAPRPPRQLSSRDFRVPSETILESEEPVEPPLEEPVEPPLEEPVGSPLEEPNDGLSEALATLSLGGLGGLFGGGQQAKSAQEGEASAGAPLEEESTALDWMGLGLVRQLSSPRSSMIAPASASSLEPGSEGKGRSSYSS